MMVNSMTNSSTTVTIITHGRRARFNRLVLNVPVVLGLEVCSPLTLARRPELRNMRHPLSRTLASRLSVPTARVMPRCSASRCPGLSSAVQALVEALRKSRLTVLMKTVNRKILQAIRWEVGKKTK